MSIVNHGVLDICSQTNTHMNDELYYLTEGDAEFDLVLLRVKVFIPKLGVGREVLEPTVKFHCLRNEEHIEDLPQTLCLTLQVNHLADV